MSQPPYSGPPYGEQPSSGQPYQSGPDGPGPQPGQPNPDVPSSLPPAYPPDAAPPEYGAPGHDAQPGYGPPGHGGQPGYDAQPGYGGQPGYDAPGYGPPPAYGQPGFAPPVPPQKKSKALPIILTVVGLVLVLCLGASVTFFLVAKRATENASQPGVLEAPGIGPAAPTATSNVKLVEPETLGGRPKLTDPQYAGVGEVLEQQFKAAPGATNSIGALYGTVAKQDVIMVAASELPVSDPAAELERNLASAGLSGVQISDISPVSTGAFGGAAKCGNAQANGLQTAVCSWADEGSSGVMILFFTSVTQAQAEFPGLRTQIETTG